MQSRVAANFNIWRASIHHVERLSILLIEDSDADAAITERVLAKESDEGATSGVTLDVQRVRRLGEALEAIDRQRFDAAILDLSLPDSRGIPTLVEFQQASGDLPVVVLTGTHEPERAIEAILSGAQEFLRKDDRMEGLARAVYFSILRAAATQQVAANKIAAVQRRSRNYL